MCKLPTPRQIGPCSPGEQRATREHHPPQSRLSSGTLCLDTGLATRQTHPRSRGACADREHHDHPDRALAPMKSDEMSAGKHELHEHLSSTPPESVPGFIPAPALNPGPQPLSYAASPALCDPPHHTVQFIAANRSNPSQSSSTNLRHSPATESSLPRETRSTPSR